MDEALSVAVQWGQAHLSLVLPGAANVADLRAAIFDATGVRPVDQKIMGFASPKPADTVALRAAAKNPARIKLSLIGQPWHAAEEARAHVAALESQARAEAAAELQLEAARARERLEREAMREREQLARDQEQQQREQEARARRQQQLRDEEAAEHGLPDATVSFDVRCHSVAVAAASDRHLSDVGDRVALPPSALQALMAARVVLPVCFRVQVVDGGRGPMYCGVAEFNAPDGVAYLPRWMMSALGADEGSLLRFSSVVLPQGTGAVLRPHRAGWRSLNQSDAGASLLADQFSRHYATLTAGATIELAAPSGGLFEFDVVSVAPDEAGAVSLLQADLAVELLPPLEDEALPLLPLGGHGTSGGGVGSRIPFLIIRPPVEGHVARTHYIYFALTLGAGQGALVRVSSSVGEADAYCSSTTRAPTDCDFQVCTVDAEAQLPSSSVARTWVVGVTCASDGPATFRLGAELAPTQQLQQQPPLQAGEMCGNCRKSIPTQSMALHALRCRHVVHYCAECALPMSMQSRAKHEAVMHATVTCRCGASFARHLVPVHAADCPLRPVKCVYCGGTVTEAERPEHTGLCGHKRARCVHCEHAGKRNEMARHAQVKHGVFKPEPRSDWHLE